MNESSLKFDIDLLADNARQFNSEEAPITKDAEVLRERFFKRIDQLSSKFKENNQVISNGTNIKINLNIFCIKVFHFISPFQSLW